MKNLNSHHADTTRTAFILPLILSLLIRRDAWANKNRIPVEADKKEGERGLYLHPDAFGQPAERSIQSRQLLQHAEPKKTSQ